MIEVFLYFEYRAEVPEVHLGAAGERALLRAHRLACGPGGGLQVQNRHF